MTSASNLSPALRGRLRRARHVALDMDGTLYSGSTLFPFTRPFLVGLQELGLGHSFLTNNCSRSPADYLVHLREMGVPVQPGQVHTSARASFSWLRTHLPQAHRLFLIGTESLAAEAVEAGFTLTAEDPTDAPDAVLVGFDLQPSFARLGRAAYWITHGTPFLATHPDLVCPTDQPTVLLDCGAVCAALTAATGVQPLAVPGKPDPGMLESLCEHAGCALGELVMVGDRLYTDMEMARRADVVGVLVLTGESTAEEAAHSPARPSLVVRDLAVLGEILRDCRA